MNEFEKILSKILRKKSLKLPYKSDDRGYFEDLKERLNDYVGQIEKTSDTGPIGKKLVRKLGTIRKTNADLIEALRQYYSGNLGKSYQLIEKLLNRDNFPYILGELVENMSVYDGAYTEAKSLFRVRLDLSGNDDATSMFHIPFDKRQLVKTQRYSIAGVPCLYLGTSLFGCWQELGKPDLNRMHLSHFKMAPRYQNTKIVDFAFTLESLKSEQANFLTSKEPKIEKSIAYFMAWPIVMACSYTVKYPNSSFQEEYIIPNMVLQWISNNKEGISGIKYVSTKASLPENIDLCVNYVFPPKSGQETQTGHCINLSESFLFSEPISWQLLDTSAEAKTHMEPQKPRFSQVDSIERYLMENYSSTKFFQSEEKLRSLAKLKSIAEFIK